MLKFIGTWRGSNSWCVLLAFRIIFCSLCFFTVACQKETLEVSKEVFHGEWDGKSVVDLYHLDSTFFNRSTHSLNLDLYNSGQGRIQRGSNLRSIYWVAESYPDLFIYSEQLSNNKDPIIYYTTHIYQIISYSNDDLELYKEDLFTQNGVVYIRKTTWLLENAD